MYSRGPQEPYIRQVTATVVQPGRLQTTADELVASLREDSPE